MPKLPGINHLQAVKALEKARFRVVRQGKHIVMSDGTRFLTIPRNNPVNAYTMGGIVRRRWVNNRTVQEAAITQQHPTTRSTGQQPCLTQARCLLSGSQVLFQARIHSAKIVLCWAVAQQAAMPSLGEVRATELRRSCGRMRL